MMKNLQICFQNKSDFKKAKKFVENESLFYGEPNEEWQMLVVECTDAQDADANEKTIEKELIENGFENFYFEFE